MKFAPPTSGLEPTLIQQFEVSYSYPVYFTEGMLNPKDPTLHSAITRKEPQRRHRIFAIIDDGVVASMPNVTGQLRAYCGSFGLTLAGSEIVPGGEATKNDPAIIDRLLARFAEIRLDRQSPILIIGGGAVLDMAGFAASIAHRGMRVIRCPTTVLAQNDGGVGVKNGVNEFHIKNFKGTFSPPWAVINDSTFLRTLSVRDQRAGMAEALKVSLIRDYDFFVWIEANIEALGTLDEKAISELILQTARLHLNHIATGGDPFENGSARPLDFGHWAAHKLEVLSDFALRHGEAVAIGMLLDSRYSVQVGRLDPSEFQRIYRAVEALGLPRWHPSLEDPSLLDGLQEFREHLGGELTVTLLDGLGIGVEVHEMNDAEIQSAISWLRASVL